MNENTFASRRTHTRIKFEPLTTSCHLVCLTPMSPATQSVNTLESTPVYEPDRSLTPTVIFPDVRAYDPDNVFNHGAANAYLSLDTIEWFVDEKPIADVWTVNVDYTIDKSEGDTRGSLTVKKNLPASGKSVLHFKAKFLDWRTGISYQVESDDLALTCTDKGSDTISCHVDKPSIVYDPVFDDLLLYDYKVARGITVQGTRNDYMDGKSYEQSVNVILNIGTKAVSALPSEYSMRVVKLGQSSALSPNSEESPELLYATFPTIKFDMRMIAKGEYEVQFVNKGSVVAKSTIGLHTEVTMPTYGQGLRSADITPSQKVYNNSALLNIENRMIDYPELYYLLKWFTQAQYNDNGTWKYASVKEWQHGEHMQVPIDQLGIGVTKNDSFFDYWFEADAHASRELCLDESGKVLVDENNVFLID